MCYKNDVFVDSHCHLELESFDGDRGDVIARALDRGIAYMLTVATERRYFERALSLADDYEQVYASLGVHPHNAEELTGPVVAAMKSSFRHRKVVACGEIGLDFYRNYAPREAQMRAFIEQIELAREHRLPIVVHSRDAREDTLEILERHYRPQPPGIMHCYSYDVATARRLLDMGFYISIPGTITYRNNQDLEQVVRYAPEDRLLSETDAPFLTPNPNRGKRNEPSYVTLTVRKMAQVRSRAVDDIAEATVANFRRAFLLDKEDKPS